jgi:hypothetical protein
LPQEFCITPHMVEDMRHRGRVTCAPGFPPVKRFTGQADCAGDTLTLRAVHALELRELRFIEARAVPAVDDGALCPPLSRALTTSP